MNSIEHIERLISEGAQYTWSGTIDVRTRSFSRRGNDWLGTPPTQHVVQEAISSPAWHTWKARCRSFLLALCGSDHPHYTLFERAARHRPRSCDVHLFAELQGRMIGALEAARSDLQDGLLRGSTGADMPSDSAAIVLHLCQRFHAVVQQLRQRRRGRSSQFVMEDEHDVQDLMHALLQLHFDDIRAEEPTPSHAGGGSKIDFFLPQSGLGVEVKRTRQNLADRKLGTELIDDIARYQQHPGCKRLICFVYDPEHRMGNPGALIEDLSKSPADGFGVDIVVSPDKGPQGRVVGH